ncbi:hypothetical protein KBY58_08145 [Cyanobium sp. HWJ4-Hawea]|uniref:hypothetical protein n=1 Tax=Cyanobium sp. HWJ4-Hawea TaxID=2823713 RepID=UPI0020CDB26F|nr:hypothetical protein [Cyanobium sp. HWJ4-Hawea]MCP9809402.1 hypothetical protein [Cyanobium sp. HWJ4-Hawea]
MARVDLLSVLREAELDGIRCGGPVILAGFVIGVGLVQVAAGPLGLASRNICELVILLVLHLVGPLVITALALVQLAPTWLQRVEQRGLAAWRTSVPAAALVAPFLLVIFLISALTSGVLFTPREDLVGEFGEVLASLQLHSLLLTWVRSSFFFAIICGWSLHHSEKCLLRRQPPAEIASELVGRGIVLLMVLKFAWLVLATPISLN